MRLLGIDYGTKRVGLALTDESGRFAAPREVLPPDEKLIPAIRALCEREQVGLIVLGESRNFRGEPNPVMKQIAKFRERLVAAVSVPVAYEPEFLTSAEAERVPVDDDLLDARAAALILKSYIDRHHD